MLKPDNSAAEQVVLLRSMNKDLEDQITELRAKQRYNVQIISDLEKIATWVEKEDVQDIFVEKVSDLSPDSEDSPENAKIIENPIR